MILISIKSEIMDCKKQFEKDLDAEKYLRRVKRIHDLSRAWMHRDLDPKYISPRQRNKRYNSRIRFIRALSTAIPLRVEIINTKANQLNLILR